MLAVAPLVWGEIAVADMDRALAFYAEHFDLTFRRENMGDMEMAILETEDPEAASIGLCKHEMMKPSLDGSTLYLHLSEKLSPLVNKITDAGVQILLPLTAINEGEHGYIALFVDSEGNKVGLWSKVE
ncbi:MULTISPECIES: VOC family protein [unclassified Agarivorans]|uniref:VOC family protein n=1 Tax=unclassified Agarivorans TaxID=2636026 RepID=UPI0010EBD846|nr:MULTISPECIES: VOC family protein [unclassified Agarivorans]MDO6687251.1 VOC family protein [Agarivorans sp. 3_MG-2023]MDO6716822.1 VOC family protein [Agarivorans sp. 2_MG-2023]MDO6765981.1 VOC family protein [Agarivorans sp. 1_MG-2023]GDY25536.1 glyoxalase [Agarivorans sp. Toyoura001]